MYNDLDKQLLADVTLLLNRVAAKSERLLENTTTNLAESWMHIRSKFDGEKVFNLCNSGSWHARCYGAAVRMNLGPEWAPKVWEQSTGSLPGCYFKQLYSFRKRQHVSCAAISQRPEQKAKRYKRKLDSNTESTRKKARREYGPEAIDVEEDLSQEKLKERKENYVLRHIELSNDKILAIETNSKTQSQSQVWIRERKKRLTSSNFGRIVNRNPKLLVKPIIASLLYSKFKGNQNTIKGLKEERITLHEYTFKKAEEGVNVAVESVGLIIDPHNKYLAASPDGKVKEIGGETGLLEVNNLLHNKPINLTEACKCIKNFCLEIVSGKMSLKNHPYYFQCQGQLHITGLPWLDFVVRTTYPYQLHIERILPDKLLWVNIMLPKLKAFYFGALLPELAVPRDGKYPGIREPGLWVGTMFMN